MMYIRDVNDESLKQRDMIVRRAKDAVATVIVNVSEGVCVCWMRISKEEIKKKELKSGRTIFWFQFLFCSKF